MTPFSTSTFSAGAVSAAWSRNLRNDIARHGRVDPLEVEVIVDGDAHAVERLGCALLEIQPGGNGNCERETENARHLQRQEPVR